MVQVTDKLQGMMNLHYPTILIQHHSQRKIVIGTHLIEMMMAEDETCIFPEQSIHPFILKVKVRFHRLMSSRFFHVANFM